jgi:hypothetical protein
MNRIVIYGLLFIGIFGCRNHPAGQVKADSLAKDSQSVYKQTSSTLSVPHSAPDTGGEDEDPSPSEIYNECIASYDKPLNIDTVFKRGGDTLELRLHYYCLKDSAIRLPKVYLDIYKMDSFITHNFETQLQLKRNGIIMLDTVVRKMDFEPLMDRYLKSFGTLRQPDVDISQDSIVLGYSISIPLTDVGIGARMSITIPSTSSTAVTTRAYL